MAKYCTVARLRLTGRSSVDGAGCAHHTDLRENGGQKTAQQLYNHYNGQSAQSSYPNGRYCCEFCKKLMIPNVIIDVP